MIQNFAPILANSSYNTKHNELPMLLNAFVYAPLQYPTSPSALYIFAKQSITPLYYLTAFKLCIIIFLFTVSPGYDINSEIMTAA